MKAKLKSRGRPTSAYLGLSYLIELRGGNKNPKKASSIDKIKVMEVEVSR